jgi:hypothetical protein
MTRPTSLHGEGAELNPMHLSMENYIIFETHTLVVIHWQSKCICFGHMCALASKKRENVCFDFRELCGNLKFSHSKSALTQPRTIHPNFGITTSPQWSCLSPPQSWSRCRACSSLRGCRHVSIICLPVRMSSPFVSRVSTRQSILRRAHYPTGTSRTAAPEEPTSRMFPRYTSGSLSQCFEALLIRRPFLRRTMATSSLHLAHGLRGLSFCCPSLRKQVR